MKTKQLCKSLLAIAALWMTGYATATAGDVTTLYERGYETAWASTDVGTGEWEGSNGTVVTEDNVLKISEGSSKTTRAILKAIEPTENVIITLDAKIYFGGGGSYSNNGSFKFGDNFEIQNTPRSNKAEIKINGVSVKSFTVTSNAELLTVNLVVNTLSNQITALSVDGESTTYLSLSDIDESNRSFATGSTYQKLTLQVVRGGSGTPEAYLKSIKVQQETQDVATYGYTVNYVAGGTTVKTVTGSLAEGAPIPVETAIDGDDSEHYLIVADAAPVQTITNDASANVLNIDVRKPYSTTVNVYYVVGGTKETDPASTKGFTETDAKVANWMYFFPYYIERSGQWYKATLKNGTDFGETGTFNTTGGSIEKEVEYTLDADAAYFDESQWTGASGIGYITCSNGERSSKTGNQSYTYSNIALTAGTYEMIVPGTSYSSCTVTMGGTEIGTIPQGGGSFVFTKADDEAVSFNFSGNMRQLDYFLIKKVSTVTVTIGETGFATYSNATAALDFTKASGLTAFAVKVNGDAIETTEVTAAVPANTGVLLQGDEGSYSVPVLSTTPKALQNNDLIATTGSNINKESGYVYYGLRKLSTGEVGFAKMGEFTPSAGKAYLKVAEATAARISFFALGDGETTGIANVNAIANDNRFYDLQGRSVQQPQKGLYIVNGRKVVIK